MNNSEYFKVDINKSDYEFNVDSKSGNAENKKSKSFFTNLYRQISNTSNEDSHNRNELRNKSGPADSLVIEKKGGLRNKYVLFLLLLWYFCSAVTLYTNKYIITSRKIDPTLIGN